MLDKSISRNPAGGQSQRLPVRSRDASSQEEVFRQLFHDYYRPVLYFFIKRGLFTYSECEELAQETFLRVYRSQASFRQKVSLKYWIFTIAANVYRNALESRATAKRNGLEVSLETEHEKRPRENLALFASSTDASPLDQLLEEEQLAMFRHAVGELPDQMRRCVTLRMGNGLKYREIAEIMQISVQTVKAHLAQGREKLKGLLSTSSGNRATRVQK